METGYFSLKQVAEKKGCHISTVRRHIKANNLKATKIQNQYRVYSSNLQKWLNGEYEFQETTEEKDVNWIDISDFWHIDGWENTNDRTSFKFIDLFSGAGGLSCGMVMAGFIPVATVEIMEQAVNTYKYNFIEQKKFSEEVESRDITKEEVKNNLFKLVDNQEIDVVVGGFPCQGFSISGLRNCDDPRNSLYEEMKKIVEHIKPKYVIMENVVGLRSMNGGAVEKKILEDFQKIGYNIDITILNSADYGVPQQRKRVIFIANRLGETNYYPKPIFSNSEYVTLGQAIEKYMNMEENITINHIFSNHTPEMKERLRKVPEGSSLYPNYTDSWRKSPWNKPSCTIKENHGGTNIHPLLSRCLSPRELAALQSFPDDFIFKGSKKSQLTQIGNAVPPLLGKAIGLTLRKVLERKTQVVDYNIKD